MTPHVALVGLVSALLLGTPQAPPICDGLVQCGNVAVTAQPGRFEAAAARSDVVPGRASASPAVAGAGRWTTVNERMVPTCSGNAAGASDGMCVAAVSSCPMPLVRFWVWHQQVSWERAADGGVTSSQGPWVQEPGSYCLGADDPGVPDYARAVALVQAGFRQLPLPRAQVQVAPAPDTLVRLPTAFYAGGPQSFSQTVTPVPGVSVTVSARPTAWTWEWGDGTSSTVGTAGVAGRPVVSHVYERVGSVAARVSVSWTGTFMLPGSSQVFDIPTPAVVTSDPMVVQVRAARTELVAR